MKKILFTCLIALTVQYTYAQVALTRIGIGVSHWERSYDGADEFSAMFQPLNATSSSSTVIPSIFAQVNLIGGFGVEGRFGLYSASFEGSSVFTGFTITESIEQRILPFSYGLVYDLPLSERWTAMLGAGFNTFTIRNEITRTVTGAEGSTGPNTFTGRQTAAYVRGALEYMVTDNIGLGLDLRYNTGAYNQVSRPEPGAAPVTREISLAGVEVGLSVRYRFSALFEGKTEKED
ncbi:MAG: hypothetical protein ACXIT9_12565 [Nitritalea sp.]